MAQGVVSTRYTNRVIYYFMLLICLFLLVVWKYVLGARSAHHEHKHKLHCPDGESAPMYHVRPGDSCWEIAESHGFTLDALLNQTLNPKLNCDYLKPNDVVCLPLNGSTSS